MGVEVGRRVLYLENGQCLAQCLCSDAGCPSHVLLPEVTSCESGLGPQGPGGRCPSPTEWGFLGAQAPGKGTFLVASEP